MSSTLSIEVLQDVDYNQNLIVKGALCLGIVQIQTLLLPTICLTKLNSKIQLPPRNTDHRQHDEGYLVLKN